MEKFTVVRTGKRDLSFTGQLLAEVSSRWVAGQGQSRWTELKLYKTDKGQYVLNTEHISQWQGEDYRSEIDIFCFAVEVIEAAFDIHGEMSNMDKELLQEAAKSDAAFQDAWVEEL